MTSSNFFNALLFSTILIGLTQCTSTEIGESKDVAQDKIYQSYQLNYDETLTNASLTCQYRFAGKDGTTLVLSAPSNVSLDGNKLSVDSSSSSGAYYQANKPAADLLGKHEIIFTDINNKKFANSFDVGSFRLKDVPLSAVKNEPLRIGFETSPLKSDDYIQVSAVNTDSSFSITDSATDTGNVIIIPESQLKRQKGAGLELVARLHRQQPLQQQTAEGGKMTLLYTLKPVKIKLK